MRYYDSLGLVPEQERETFWEYMKKDLPNSFRFTGSKGSVHSENPLGAWTWVSADLCADMLWLSSSD